MRNINRSACHRLFLVMRFWQCQFKPNKLHKCIGPYVVTKAFVGHRKLLSTRSVSAGPQHFRILPGLVGKCQKCLTEHLGPSHIFRNDNEYLYATCKNKNAEYSICNTNVVQTYPDTLWMTT